VRLAAGRELIIVIPAIKLVNLSSVGTIHQFYCKKFCRIIARTCAHINPADCASLAEDALVDHQLQCNNATILQFCVRVNNYPEQCHFESQHLNNQLVDMYWKQGACINIAVCAYTTQVTVLLQFKHIAFLEVYQLTKDDSYLSKNIAFGHTSNPTKLVTPFLQQLALVEGCCFGMVETLWKFYRAQSVAKQMKLDHLEKRLTSGGTLAVDSSLQPKTNPTPNYLLTFIKSDLRDENVDVFESYASNAYKNSFEVHYSGFALVGCNLVDQHRIKELYWYFTDNNFFSVHTFSSCLDGIKSALTWGSR
jgi:hypothetical protein